MQGDPCGAATTPPDHGRAEGIDARDAGETVEDGPAWKEPEGRGDDAPPQGPRGRARRSRRRLPSNPPPGPRERSTSGGTVTAPRRVLLQTDLVVDSDDGVVAERQSGARQGATLPVFVSESSGELMTLPGGVLLVFVPDWSRDQIDTFFAEQGIKQHLVTAQTFTTNAFFIETDPGFPSLELANALAGEDGVLLARPNWQREVSTR